MGMNRYSWENELVIREQHDSLGRVRKQICVLKSNRSKVLQLAHEGLSHQSKTKVTHHI